MSRKRRTRSERQHKKKLADNTRSEQPQDTPLPSNVMGADNPSGVVLESEPAAAKLREIKGEDLCCDDDAPDYEKLIGEPANFKEGQILDEIQAVQVYMDGLLKRARGENGPDSQIVPAAPRSKQVPAQARSEKPPASATANPGDKPSCDCPPLPPLAELTPRSQPPESIGWRSMRELANSQARAAIDTHQRFCLARSILNNGAAGLACLIGTVVALICAPILGQTMSVGRMAGVVASIYFLYASFLSARAWLTSRPSSFD